jgi:hypothetical protein
LGPKGDPKNMQTVVFVASGGNSENISSLRPEEARRSKERAQGNEEIAKLRICLPQREIGIQPALVVDGMIVYKPVQSAYSNTAEGDAATPTAAVRNV